MTRTPIAIFYHVFQKETSRSDPDRMCWQDMYLAQINRLKTSGLYDAADHIQVSINGDKPLPYVDDKIKVKYNKIQDSESQTLLRLWYFALAHRDHAILYMHTKGISFIDQDQERYRNCLIWRDYLEYFTIDLWQTNIEKLEHHDTSGTEAVLKVNIGGSEWSAPCYGGNFWWATATYISKLNPYFILREDINWARWASEFWIGSCNPRMFNFYSSPGKFGKDKYFDPVTRQEALNNLHCSTILGQYHE